MKISNNSMKSTYAWAPLLVGAATILSLSACTKEAPKPAPSAYSQAHAEQLIKEGKALEAADHYARLGELLLMPEGAEYADQMFAKALEIDPKNGKANFYKAATEPAMVFKGFIPRIERLLTTETSNRDLERLRQEISKLKMPEVSQFANSLPQGEAPFLTYYDIQRFLREKVLPAVLASVDKLGRIDSNTPLKLNFTPERVLLDPVRRDSTYSWSQCSNDPVQGWKCESYEWRSGRSEKLRNEYFVDQHDLKILKSSFMALANSIRLATAYSFKDSEYVIRRLKAVDTIRYESGLKGLSAQDVVDVLREFNDLFVLERDHQLVELSRSSAEILKTGLELDDMRSELCDGKTRTDLNALFHPICIGADVVDAFHIGLDMLAGPKEMVLGKNSSGRDVKIVVDLSRTLSTPPRDLKALLPTTFDAKGEPVNYPDPTLGGLFPNGDLIQKLKEVGQSPVVSSRLMKQIRRAIRSVRDHL